MSPSGEPARVVVLGSANTDVVLAVPRVPAAGETLLATSTAHHPGGKGLNQVVAVARAGAAAVFIGAVGDDEAGTALVEVLREAGADTRLLRRVAEPTGTAHIAVQDDGDNAIIVAPGANGTLDALTDADAAAFDDAAVLVLSLEVPLEGVVAAARRASAAGAVVVLNAAPARELPDELLDLVDVLVVNEHEAALLAGSDDGGDGGDGDDVAASARALLRRVSAVVVTLGGSGALVVRRGEAPQEVAAPRVDVVDTTGAGDTATGYLAAGLAAGLDLPGAVRRAVVAGSLAVQRAGAVPSIPTAGEVDEAADASGGAGLRG